MAETVKKVTRRVTTLINVALFNTSAMQFYKKITVKCKTFITLFCQHRIAAFLE